MSDLPEDDLAQLQREPKGSFSFPDYSWIHSIGRRLGHTTTAAKAARESGGILVVNHQCSVSIIGREHCCKAVALQHPQGLEGCAVPVLFDLEAVKQIVSDYEERIRELEDRGQAHRKTRKETP